MEQVLVVDALRTPVGRRDGGLSAIHPARLLGGVLTELLRRTAVDGEQVQQVIAGCVTEVGEQAFNIGRTAWLAAGLPEQVGATTVDAQCGSSQQAFTLATGLIRGGLADVVVAPYQAPGIHNRAIIEAMALGRPVVACGVESMSRIPIGSNYKKELGLGRPITPEYMERYRFLNQFQAAEAIAGKWEVTRERADEFGLLSQQRAKAAWTEGRFSGQIVPVEADTETVTRDEGLRETSLEALSHLKPVVPDGIHTAGTASQISGSVIVA